MSGDLSLPDRPAWHALAECAGVDPDLFFPERGGDISQAKQVCAVCAVRAECLRWALDNGETQGVWGGLGPRARRRLRNGGTAHLRPIAHGTNGGYQAHLRRDSVPCEACRDAHNVYLARSRPSRARQLAPTPANPPLVAVESGDPRTVTHGGPGDNLQAAAG